MTSKKKIILLLLSFVVILFICSTKSEAATLLWPIGGSNAGDTYIEYGYERRLYKSQAYIDKCKELYGLEVTEGYYYKNENHYGVDIFGIPGQTYEVVAVANGTVVGTSANYISKSRASTNYVNRNQRRTTQGMRDGGGYGNFIAIQDNTTGKCYLYAHLKGGSLQVKKGDTVTAGQQIAIMGSSGDSGHMHLHFEVRKTLKNLFRTPYSSYSYFTLTTGYNIQTENPVDYIGTSPRREYTDKKTVGLEHSDMISYVKYLYRAAIGREASEEEAESWANSYDADQSLARITQNIIFSTEGLNHMGTLDNTAYIKYIYKILLLRTSEPVDAEIAGHLSKLDNGTWNRNDFVTMICNCTEFTTARIRTILENENKKTEPTKYITGLATEDKLTVIGDLNADGIINSTDASILFQLELSDKQTYEYYSYAMKYADVDGDGYLNAVDASWILSYSAKCGAGIINPNTTSITDFIKK